MLGNEERTQRCRLQDANARQAPLLVLAQGNLPKLIEGERAIVQVLVQNLTGYAAHDVTLRYRGHVQQAGESYLGTIGPRRERLVEIAVVPTASGSAELILTLRYQDGARTPQPPVHFTFTLSVSRPPELHQHFHGPTVTGDGVIIMRGAGGRQVRVQSGEDEIEIKRPRTCPNCGEALVPPYHSCGHCGWRL